MTSTHELQIALATALRERDEARALAEKWARREAAGVERGIRADADALSEIQGLQAALAAARRECEGLRVQRTADAANYGRLLIERNDARARAGAMESALSRAYAVLVGTLARRECAEGWNETLRTAQREAEEAFKYPLATEARIGRAALAAPGDGEEGKR